MMKIKILTLFILIIIQAVANEEKIFIGEVFDINGQVKKFTCQRHQSRQNHKMTDHNVCKDLRGKVLVVEKMQRNGDELVRYHIDQKQLKQKAWIELKNDKVIFNLLEVNSKKPQQKTIDRPKNFVVSMQIVPFIVEHWQVLAKGEKKKIRLGVWNRQKAVPFDLSRKKMDKEVMIVKMSPSGFFARAIVDPIYFTMSVKDRTVVEYKGRTNLKEKKGNDYHDYKGLIRYKSL